MCALIAASPAEARGLSAPALVSPANGSQVQQLPAITWNAVRGAAGYEYQISGDSRFNSIALGSGAGKGTSRTHNLAAALDKSVGDGTYYWRVRALTAKGKAGPWSRARKLTKQWTLAPQLTAGNGASVDWPTTPLVLRWSAVPFATKYIVSVATDPGLSNLVLGSATKPQETQARNFAMPVSLAPGAYYWAITPLDAEGHPGRRSGIGTFQWRWPTTTQTNITDLNPGFGPFDDPMFSWNPIPGAARYEVEVNAAEGFPAGSKWCCAGTTTGTSLAPLQVLANNRYYWRVRAIDARGNAGVWNVGQPFEKTFDSSTPTIPNLTVRDVFGNPQAGNPATDTPIVTWDPVPGASRYEVQIGPYHGGFGCDWSPSSSPVAIEPTNPYRAFTASTAWTPLAADSAGHQGPSAWPFPQRSAAGDLPAKGTSYCVRVLARSDDDAQRGQVVSAWTQISGSNQPAFTYLDPPPAGSPGPEGLVTPASAYLQPASGTTTTRTPLFTWNRVPGAQGYFVVIARDPRFTEVADVGFTDVPAYAPRAYNEAPLADETTQYYWAVMPSARPDGHEVFSTPCYTTPFNPCGADNDNPQIFNKSSIPPSPVAPASGAEVFAQPTFQWTPAENARNYRLQVSQDPTFGKPIDDVTTDATAYTSSSTYPADTVLYWRVRANDWIGQGLNWSQTRVFVRRLLAPTQTSANPITSVGTTAETWTAVQGAIGYDVHVDQPSGKSDVFSFEAPSATFGEYYGTGFGHWQVRAEFPTGTGGKVAGPYSSLHSVLLQLPAPEGARGVKSGSRLLVTWSPEPDVKRYRVEVSTTGSFISRTDSHTVDGTSWAPDIDLSRKQNRGTLYWRVAPVDSHNGVGSFAEGTFGRAPVGCAAQRGKAGRKHVLSRCAKKRRAKKRHR